MPRARQGTKLPNPAQNRSDLLTQKPPRMEVPSQTYGQRTSQEQSQRIIPPSGPQVAAPTLAAQAATGGAGPSPQPAGPVGAASGAPAPIADWLRPTERPGEPTTHGLDIGAGAGSDVMNGAGALMRANTDENQSLKGLLGYLASRPGASSTVKALAQGA